jgi:hypothetical protein
MSNKYFVIAEEPPSSPGTPQPSVPGDEASLPGVFLLLAEKERTICPALHQKYC